MKKEQAAAAAASKTKIPTIPDIHSSAKSAPKDSSASTE